MSFNGGEDSVAFNCRKEKCTNIKEANFQQWILIVIRSLLLTRCGRYPRLNCLGGVFWSFRKKIINAKMSQLWTNFARNTRLKLFFQKSKKVERSVENIFKICN